MSNGDNEYEYLSSLEDLDKVLSKYNWRKIYEELDNKLVNMYYEKGEVTLEIDYVWGGLVKAKDSSMETGWFGIDDCRVHEGKLAFLYTKYDEDYGTEYLEMIKIKL